MKIYITEEEFDAIFEAENELSTSIEAADDEYVQKTIPTINALNRVIDKYKKARSDAMLFNDVRREIRACYLKRGSFINGTELNRMAREAIRKHNNENVL